jgi:hypothetical protein
MGILWIKIHKYSIEEEEIHSPFFSKYEILQSKPVPVAISLLGIEIEMSGSNRNHKI